MPALFVAAVWLPDVFTPLGIVPALVLVVGLTFFFGKIAEERSPLIEEHVLVAPSDLVPVHLLRHRDTVIDPATKARYHAYLNGRGFILPSPAVEAAGTLQADRAYMEAVDWLKRRTKDPAAYPELAQIRGDYVYRLHLLSLRELGLAVAAVAIGINIVLMYQYFFIEGHEFWMALALSLGSLGMVAFWRTQATKAVAEEAGRQLGMELLAHCDVLAGSAAGHPASTGWEEFAGVVDY